MSDLAKIMKGGLAALIISAPLFAASVAQAEQRPFGLGQIATAEEVPAGILMSSGRAGRPEGTGNAWMVRKYMQNVCCLSWRFGEGWITGQSGWRGSTLKSEDPVKTTGSYWPYALPCMITSIGQCLWRGTIPYP